MSYTQNWNFEFQKNTAFLDRNSLVNVIEVGAFEGLTTNYISKELLAHNGKIIAIDPLDSEYILECDESLFQGQFERFMENTESIRDRLMLMRTPSQEILPMLAPESQDFIYIDGDHRRPSVYNDSIYAFKLLRTGGYLLWDDYLWNPPSLPVKGAIDQFLSEITNYRLLLKLNQVLIQKLPEGSSMENGQEEYQNKSVEKLFNENTIYAAYNNLDIRPDRREHMENELKRVGISMERRRSFPWQELYNDYTDEQKKKVDVMYKRTPGAVGCHYSQVAIMEEALKQGKHAWVNEDDIIMCDDLPARLKIIYKFLNTHDWDIFFFGGTYHIEPTWHKSIEGRHMHPEMKEMCKCDLNRDWEETFDPHIVRTYGCFSTHSYLVNKNRIENLLGVLERNVHLSMGIDWIMLKEQPNLNCFAFKPGCIKQMDSMSNISNAFAKQSGFAKLGPHWFQNVMG